MSPAIVFCFPLQYYIICKRGEGRTGSQIFYCWGWATLNYLPVLFFMQNGANGGTAIWLPAITAYMIHVEIMTSQIAWIVLFFLQTGDCIIPKITACILIWMNENKKKRRRKKEKGGLWKVMKGEIILTVRKIKEEIPTIDKSWAGVGDFGWHVNMTHIYWLMDMVFILLHSLQVFW